jgi:hypothetical protein
VDQASQIKLEINQDSIRLVAAPNLYKLSCWLTELQLDSDRTSAQFDYSSRELNITSAIV